LGAVSTPQLYRKQCGKDEIAENLSLAMKLRSEFRVAYPGFPEIEDLQPAAYFDLVARATSGLSRWRVEPDIAQLKTPIVGPERHLAIMGVPDRHPFKGSGLTALLPSDRQMIEEALEAELDPLRPSKARAKNRIVEDPSIRSGPMS
jgi:hypothetical protein